MTAFEEDFQRLRKLYASLGVTKGRTVFLTGNAGRVIRYRSRAREDVLRAHLSAIQDLLGPEGTILSPAASMNLCNTDIPFDPVETPSHEMGALAEYIRIQEGCVRSFHPFWSVSGLGPSAPVFLNDVSRHAYGWGSPWQRMAEHDVLQVNVGLHPSRAVTLIHHIEVVSGVPYRYTKEFNHPVVRNGNTSREDFYMNVMYRDADIERRHVLNEHFFENLSKHGTFNSFGEDRECAWSFSMTEFFKLTTKMLERNIYAYLERPPSNRPYRN